VAAGIEKAAQLTLGVTRHQHRLPADMAGDVVMRLGQLRFMAQKSPAALEDVALLQFKQGRIGIHIAMHPEDLLRRAIVHITTAIPLPPGHARLRHLS
jgi:hypothetical protein